VCFGMGERPSRIAAAVAAFFPQPAPRVGTG
jgi:hypothetical protein